MNQLEINLTLWAVCSIVLFEILIIICLCRCCFNRIKPKKLYVKREEYEYLQDINNGTQSKFHSTILRPPHADELALIGTIRAQNPVSTYNSGIQNLGFYRHDEDERIPTVQSSLSQHWLELQPTIINTAQLPPADYEIRSYPTDDYLYANPPPRPTIIDFRQYADNEDEIENFRFQSLRRPEIFLPQVKRVDTSTESLGINYSNIVPKSILKSGTGTTPPLDFLATPYLPIQYSRASSKYDESLRTTVKINTDQDYHTSAIEKRIPIESIFSSTMPLPSKQRMKFASVSQLNNIEWEVPREFRNQISHSNRQRTPTKTQIPWQNENNTIQTRYLRNDDITQQQALEY